MELIRLPVFHPQPPISLTSPENAEKLQNETRASIAADHGSLKVPSSSAHNAVTKKIEEIADSPSLSDKEKRRMINDLRKQLGLSKGDMKKFYTKPLEQSYARQIEHLKMSGIDSPEKEALLNKLEARRKLYMSMYKPGGCVKKMFKGMSAPFRGIGEVVKGAAKTAWKAVKGVLNPKNWIKPAFWRDVVAPVALSFVPGIGHAFSIATRVYEGAKQKMDDIQKTLGG